MEYQYGGWLGAYITGKVNGKLYKIDTDLMGGLHYIQPGNPQQNAYIECFNRTVRYDWLSHYIYRDIEELEIEQHNGYGLITMSDLTWYLVALLQFKNLN